MRGLGADAESSLLRHANGDCRGPPRHGIGSTLRSVTIAAVESLSDSETLQALHITGYSARRMEDFQVVADQVEWAAQHPWHL